VRGVGAPSRPDTVLPSQLAAGTLLFRSYTLASPHTENLRIYTPPQQISTLPESALLSAIPINMGRLHRKF